MPENEDKYRKYGKYSKYVKLVDKYGGGFDKCEKKNRKILRKLTFPS